jgi:hypothetical protein
MKKEHIFKIVEDMIKAEKGDHSLLKKLIVNHPWTRKWLERTSSHAMFESIVSGENIKIKDKELGSELRKERGLRPLLQVWIRSTTGEICINFEPSGKDGFKIRE